MPLRDWQFWLVTILAAGALWLLVRPFIQRAKSRDQTSGAACPTCPTGSSAKPRGQRRRVALTIDRKRV